jgi:hypothetical protein
MELMFGASGSGCWELAAPRYGKGAETKDKKSNTAASARGDDFA